MTMASSLAAVLVFMAGAPAPAGPAPADVARVFEEAQLIRRPVQFGPSAEGVRLEVLAGRDRCRFEGSDGRTARKVWLLSRDGAPVAVVPIRSFAVDPAQMTRMGQLRPPEHPLLAPAHGALPLSDGTGALEARLKREAWGPEVQVALRCLPPPTPRPESKPPLPLEPTVAEKVVAIPFQAAGLVIFSPIILFGVPSENASLVQAAAKGPSVADLLTPGAPVPGGLDAFAREHRGLVRVLRDPGSDYAVVTVDLGGKPRYGIGTPRDAVFFGVRNGVVEWRAERDMGVETSLCANARGEFGGRKGCSTTGYYNPRF